MVNLQLWFEQFINNKPIVQILDILIVWYLIYKLLMYARGTQVMNLLKGVGIFIAAKFISSVAGLQTIDWILGQILAWGVVAAIILFQPELRRALQMIGQSLFRNRKTSKNPNETLIENLEQSLKYMSKRKIGALISIEGKEPLSEFIETGIRLDSEISFQLLINIFVPNTPLHDGAVIIRNYKIASASCYLPLSESSLIPKELGTRHRAAIGLSEVTDALTLIVSEETGDISLVKHEVLHRGVKADELHNLLVKYLMVEAEQKEDTKDSLVGFKEYFLENLKQWGDRNE
ncbi:diadenylate cyclase CdaA [Ignavigranum ruoffiae]|uniref:diadenylate cyclase CdaA n=1 Tax=Ignavigranum ruoffiae TaxID=89093 RepID=UPI0023522181|nr:diadenylate cyclase CdaA [Ignavigranum ruoffiae]